MNHGLLRSLKGLKGLADNVLSGLGQYLDGHIVRNQILLNQGSEKCILCLGSRRKSYLDLLKTYLTQKLEEACGSSPLFCG